MTHPLPILALHHISRITKHLDASIAFYRDVLGFQEIPRPAFQFGGAWLFNYGLEIHLIVDASTPDPLAEISSRVNHIAFMSHDVAATEQRLIEHQIAYRVNIQSQTGLRQLFFCDPDGHHVEVATYGVVVSGL